MEPPLLASDSVFPVPAESMWRCLIMLLVIALVSSAIVRKSSAEEQAPNSFDREIAPLLAAHCLECHSGTEPAGELDLSRSDKVLSGGESGPAVVPGKLEESLLWQYVEAGEMPPKDKRPPLSEVEKQRLKTWIRTGAAWGTDPIDPFRFSSSRRAGTDWWSLAPLQTPPIPRPHDRSWPANPIDAFVLARLEANGLTPSAPAAPRVQIRRLYFDLVGLPPPPDLVARFEADPSERAYHAIVDQLLASPHYGERWARHWLDVVRYGESDGFERNMPRKEAWPYRDWVISALNRDLPYDEFARLQVAGDVLAPEDPRAIQATGFLVAGIHNTVVANNDLARQNAQQDEWEDLVANVGQTFLGLTVQCARCHDHKFDPIGQRDYYRFVAALAGVQHGEREQFGRAEIERRQRLATVLEVPRLYLARQIAGFEKSLLARIAERDGAAPAGGLPSFGLRSRWSFDADARDLVGSAHAELHGDARIVNGRLRLNGTTAFAMTPPLDSDLAERTFEVWLTLSDLDQQGGGAMTVESLDGALFDALVYGERQPRRWMAGSNSFVRTRDVNGPDETSDPATMIHVAVVYRADGHIQLFRNGISYGDAYRPDGDAAGLAIYKAGAARILFGKRHTGGGRPWLAAEIEEARLYDRALTAEELTASFAAGPSARLTNEQVLAEMSPEERQQYAEWVAQHDALKNRIETLRRPAHIYAARSTPPPPLHVLQRGNVTKPGELVAPGGIACIEGSDFGLPPDAPDADRRRDFAHWLTRADNPLFARVIVNRLWHYHFGIGLVDTPSDFGFNGGRPTHPELLDWLASSLIADGFKLKALHRRLVTSQSYRQSGHYRPEAAKLDADNRLLWRKTPQRLEAEAVRDAMLYVSGELNTTIGGRPYEDVRTYFNAGTTYYEPLEATQLEHQRRTIYRFSPRGERSPLLDTFDCPDPSVSTPRRQITTTPLQALAMLNDELVLSLAERFAEQLEQADDPIAAAFTRMFQRAPTTQERAAATEFVREHGMVALARALFNSNEFVIVE